MRATCSPISERLRRNSVLEKTRRLRPHRVSRPDFRRLSSADSREAGKRHLKGFDVAHVWFGGGAMGSFSTFATEVRICIFRWRSCLQQWRAVRPDERASTQAASRAGVPVIQNLAWNVKPVARTATQYIRCGVSGIYCYVYNSVPTCRWP